MKRYLQGLALLVASVAAANHHNERMLLAAAEQQEAASTGDWKHFGAEFTIDKAQPAAELAEHLADSVGKTVRIEATVADVCQKKGCWMMVLAGKHNLRVTMKDYGFFVPTDSKGGTADLEGTLVEKPVDPDLEKHYASESSVAADAPAEGPDHILKVYEFVATSISVKK